MIESVRIEDVNSVKKMITVTAPKEEVELEFDNFFNKIKKNCVIKGFRKGFVPMSVLKQRFNKQAKISVAQSITAKKYAEVIKDSQIKVIGNPVVTEKFKNDENLFFTENNEFSCELYVDVLPKIDPTGYTGLNLKLPLFDEQQILSENLLELRKKFSQKMPVQRACQKYDMVSVDIDSVFESGEPVSGGKADGVVLHIGLDSQLIYLENHITGMCIGEKKQVLVDFADIKNTIFGDKKVLFTIIVNSVIEVVLPEVNDEFAQMNGKNSVEELMSDLVQKISVKIKQIERKQLEEQITLKLLELNKFDLPESYINNKDLKEQTVRAQILLDSIFDKENLSIDPAEFDSFLESQAQIAGKQKDILISELQNSNQLDTFMYSIKLDKVLQFIISKANIERK